MSIEKVRFEITYTIVFAIFAMSLHIMIKGTKFVP